MEYSLLVGRVERFMLIVSLTEALDYLDIASRVHGMC